MNNYSKQIVFKQESQRRKMFIVDTRKNLNKKK